MNNIKNLDKAIKREQNKLMKKAKEKGLWENFGQKVAGKLENDYINSSSYTDDMNVARDKIQQFREWCMNVGDKDVQNW